MSTFRNRLTFSLASLIFLIAFGLVFVPTSALAQNPKVTIEAYTGKTDPNDSASGDYTPTRADFRVKLTFSHSVEVITTADVQYRLLDASTNTYTTSADVSSVTAVTASSGKIYMVNLPGVTNALHTLAEIIIEANVTRGTGLNVGGNSAASKTFVLPAQLAADAAFDMPMASNTQGTYTVNLTFTNNNAPGNDGSGDNTAPDTPALTSNYIDVEPARAGVNITVGTVTSVTGTPTTAGTATYPLTVQLLSGTNSVKLSVDPGFAGTANVTIPSALPAPVVTATANDNGNIDVSWTWDGVADNLTEFSLSWGSSGSATVAKADPLVLTHTINRKDVTPGTSYAVSVTAVATTASNFANGIGTSASVTAKTPKVPDAPTKVTAQADDAANTITVSWTEVAGLTYEVTKTYMKAGAAQTKKFPDAESPLMLPEMGKSELDQGVEFSFTVTATDSDNLTSTASTAAKATLKIDVKPTVDISVQSQGSNNFVARFTFAEATMISKPTTADPNAGVALDEDMYDAVAVPTSLVGSTIKVTSDAAGMNYANIPGLDNASRLNNPNVFDLTVNYTGASLPLYVTLEDAADHVSAIGLSGGTLTFVSADDTSTPALMVISSKTPTIEIPHATSSSEKISLGDHTIEPYDFFVLVRDKDASGIYDPGSGSNWGHSENVSLPDLDWFFGTRVVRGIKTNGGTIALHGPATGSVSAKDLIFSEIMWGTDSSLAVDECSQWIEFYNATPTAIDLSGYTIQFHRSQVASSAWSGALDVVSNVNATSIYFTPSEFPGQSGRSNIADSQDAADRQTQVDLISMYRELDEPRIKSYHTGNRGERDKGIKGWKASQYPTANISPIHIATPGAHQIVHTTLTKTEPHQRVIINEIGNSNTDAYDWIELHNTTDTDQPIKEWEFTRVEKSGNVGQEHRIVRFPDIKIPAKGYLVIAASHPENVGNDLAGGIDITKDATQRQRGLGMKGDLTANYLVNSNLKIENNTTRYLYILRDGKDKLGSAGNVADVVGTLSIEARGDLQKGFTGHAEHVRQLWDTATWPLQKWGGVHGDVITDGPPENFRQGYVYQRNGKNSGIGEHHLSVRSYTGVGYDRHALVNDENGGTPGYSNGHVVGKVGDLNANVSISEIMIATHETDEAGNTRVRPVATRLPQWIEIYNGNMDRGVSLNNWYLELLNAPSDELGTRDIHGTMRLPNVVIPPNQTVLIVTTSGLNSGHFPEQRVIDLYRNANARREFNISNRDQSVLSQEGFYIQLRDHENKHVDEIGNLDVVHDARRTGVQPRDPRTFNTKWDFTFADDPEKSKLNADDGSRTSLMRIYDNVGGKSIPRDGLLPIGGPADKDSGWVRASDTAFRNVVVPSLTYYGNHRDYGTPGYRGGGPLPVSLSKFRPERLKNTGDVVIRWVTESELNNAGFNILRSETRDGEFTKLNEQLILGQGTTSERTAYEWKDTTAKPNVVYYYQIQDVSLDGNVQTLRQSRLKGNVTPAGKLTTTWGELKTLRE